MQYKCPTSPSNSPSSRQWSDMNTQPTPKWSLQAQHQRVTLLNHILLAAVILGLAGLILLFVESSPANTVERLIGIIPFAVGWLAILIACACRNIRHSTRVLALLLIVYILAIVHFVWSDSPASARVWLLLSPALAFALLGTRSIILCGAISIVTNLAFTLAIRQEWLGARPAATYPTVPTPGILAPSYSFTIVAIALTWILWRSSQNSSHTHKRASSAHMRLQAQTQQLEASVARVQRQSSELQAALDIAQASSAILGPDKLLDQLDQLVNRIQGGFSQAGVYYVGLLLLNEPQQVAVLRAATGEAGKLLLDMGYKQTVDQTSTIGRCITHGQARIAPDGDEGALQFGNLPMPDARSEIALPLRARGRTLGALSMTSTKKAAFTEADVAILQTMADQVAVAIDNATLYTQTRTALDQLQAVQHQHESQAWADFLSAKPRASVDYVEPGAELGSQQFLNDARRAAIVHGRTVATTSPPLDDNRGNGDRENGPAPQAALVVPLKLRAPGASTAPADGTGVAPAPATVIGTIALHQTGDHRSWTADEIGLAENIAEQVSLTVENLRLMEETQRRATQERVISQVATSTRETLDMETVIKTAVQEIRQVLGLPEVSIRLAIPDTPLRPSEEGAASLPSILKGENH